MNLFKKRETIVENISYMAIMAAINVVFVLLTNFVPFLFLLIVFVLPLTSTIVILFCNKKYFLIYAISTIGLCLLITIGDTLFYVLPSVITGAIFGLLIEKGISNCWIIISGAIIQTILTYASLPLIELFSGVSVIDTFIKIFGLETFAYIDYLIPITIFFISLMQTVISFMVVKDELEKLNRPTIDELKFKDETILISLISALAIVSIVFTFIFGPISYLSMCLLIFLSINLVASGFLKMNKWLSISIGVTLIISFFLFASLYQYVKEPYSLLLISIFFLIPSYLVYGYSLFKKIHQN